MRTTITIGQTTQLRVDTPIVLDLAPLFEGEEPGTSTITNFELLDGDGQPIDLQHRLHVVIDPTLLTVTLIPKDTWRDQAPFDPLVNVASLRSTDRFGTFTLPAAMDFDPSYNHTADGEDTDDVLTTITSDGTPMLPVRMNGYQGNDRLTVVGSAGVLFGGDGADTLRGGVFDDALLGEAGNDALYGADGIDRLVGGGGNDRIFGGAGLDHLDGGDGNDLLQGGAGNDILINGGGNDTLRGEAGDDRIELSFIARNIEGTIFTASTLAYGGDGNDTFDIVGNSVFNEYGNATSGNVTLHGGAGNDSVYVSHLDSGTIYGGAGNDVLRAYMNDHTEGNTRIYGGLGDDSIHGGQNVDAFGGLGNDYITVDNGGSARGDAGVDVLTVNGDDEGSAGDEGGQLFGGSGSDFLNGSWQRDTLRGGDDGDSLFGGNGMDQLFGGHGNDRLEGGTHSDLLNGGEGDNELIGGTGFDTFVFESATGHTRIMDFAAAEELAFDASALNLGNGDEAIDNYTTITTDLDQWSSGNEVVVLDMGVDVDPQGQASFLLSLHAGEETAGVVNLIVARNEHNTYFMRHVADGVHGVDANDLTLIGTLEGYTGGFTTEIFFM